MEEPYESFRRELRERDPAPASRLRYWECVSAFRQWLQGSSPTPAAARAFLAYLEQQGYKQRSPSTFLRIFNSSRHEQAYDAPPQRTPSKGSSRNGECSPR